jgi:hypothetical protein
MREAIDTIAIEMIVPADDELLPTLLASTDPVGGAEDDALGEILGDFDGDAFGEVRAVAVAVGVGVWVWLTRGPSTTTVPVMSGWIEQ